VEKSSVRSIFDSIARRYDLLNHLLSGGIDIIWRARAVRMLRHLKPERILDAASGTGDFALAAAVHLEPSSIVGIDISEQMLALGRDKIRNRKLDHIIRLETGDAERLQFQDGSFDAAIIAFGVRNFENLSAGLQELLRVLRPGGGVLILEFSRPRAFPFRQLYFLYFRRIVPFIGRLVSRHPTAYTHLRESVMRFPEGEAFVAIMNTCGFAETKEKRFSCGIVSVYTGTKPSRDGSRTDPGKIPTPTHVQTIVRENAPNEER
jgi:demethylmenaquinone methyltransferase/2-methoxy-6-polyprenyl-1,4-benzoquinol methylase